jgi:hypothetical protein
MDTDESGPSCSYDEATGGPQPSRLAIVLQQLQVVQDELYKAQGEQGEAFQLQKTMQTVRSDLAG